MRVKYHQVMESTTIRAALRRALPFAAWQTAGFVKRLPSYWRIDRSQALRIRNGVRGLPLYVTDSISVLSPDLAIHDDQACAGLRLR
jgi:hypothetical protein